MAFSILHVFPYDPGDKENGPRIEWDFVEVEEGFESEEAAQKRMAVLLEGEWKDKDLRVEDMTCEFCKDKGCYACCDPGPEDFK